MAWIQSDEENGYGISDEVRGYGVPEPGQPARRDDRGRGCCVRAGEYRRSAASRSGERVDDAALEQVGMGAFKDRAPHMLSGGQKQRVAIAGVLAMHPELIIVFDEPTAMLDPEGRSGGTGHHQLKC